MNDYLIICLSSTLANPEQLPVIIVVNIYSIRNTLVILWPKRSMHEGLFS
jgi:hypothetical protein